MVPDPIGAGACRAFHMLDTWMVWHREEKVSHRPGVFRTLFCIILLEVCADRKRGRRQGRQREGLSSRPARSDDDRVCNC